MNRKPLGIKCYGHIPHLPESRIGPGDHKCSEGQAKIACECKRDKHDRIIVQEKLDGANVGVAKIDGAIVALSRSGYLASSSPYIQHHFFDVWVNKNKSRFDTVLSEKERLCGEWLLVKHGTHYDLPHEPFVAFDIIDSNNIRIPYDEFERRASGFVIPNLISIGDPVPAGKALLLAGKYGSHGAGETIEGCVWRVERERLIDKKLGNAGGREWVVDFLVKYVRPNKEDGKYLGERIYYNSHL